MLFLRALRWRLGFSAAVLLVGMISAAIAAIGPLYARASSESTLTDDLTAAGSRTGLAFTATHLARQPDAAAQTLRDIGPRARVDGYDRPIVGESTVITALGPRAQFTTPSTMVWRTGACGHLVIIRGHCPVRGRRGAGTRSHGGPPAAVAARRPPARPSGHRGAGGDHRRPGDRPHDRRRLVPPARLHRGVLVRPSVLPVPAGAGRVQRAPGRRRRGLRPSRPVPVGAGPRRPGTTCRRRRRSTSTFR